MAAVHVPVSDSSLSQLTLAMADGEEGKPHPIALTPAWSAAHEGPGAMTGPCRPSWPAPWHVQPRACPYFGYIAPGAQALAQKAKKAELAHRKRRERQRAIEAIYGSSPYERPVIDMQASGGAPMQPCVLACMRALLQVLWPFCITVQGPYLPCHQGRACNICSRTRLLKCRIPLKNPVCDLCEACSVTVCNASSQ